MQYYTLQDIWEVLIDAGFSRAETKKVEDALIESWRGTTFKDMGTADVMPGSNGGFTMAAFNGESVPPGTQLYIKG